MSVRLPSATAEQLADEGAATMDQEEVDAHVDRSSPTSAAFHLFDTVTKLDGGAAETGTAHRCRIVAQQPDQGRHRRADADLHPAQQRSCG